MLGQTMKLHVVGKSRYKFENENGKELKGSKIFVQANPVNEPDKVGVFQTELSLSNYDDFEKFTAIPADYEVEMVMEAGKNGAKFIVQTCKLIPAK